MLEEFKKFIARGNVMDMAVGIIIGAAFTAVVKSMVDDLVNPIVGLFTGGLDLSGWFYVLGEEPEGGYVSLEAAREAGAAVFAMGSFLMALINFLIVAWVVFLLVRGVNRLKDAAEREEAEAETPPAPDPGPSELDILVEIRDALNREG